MQPPFTRVAIVGLGLIGGSLALAIRERWSAVRIVGIDPRAGPEPAPGMLDAAGDRLALAADADLIILAAPVRTNTSLLADIHRETSGAVLVTDVGSTKGGILQAAAALPERITFVGGHPIAGAAAGGLPSARADLFAGCSWVLTTPAEGAALDRLEQFIRELGASPVRMTADAHDRLFAYVSHLPQLAVSALMAVVGAHTGAEGLALAGAGLRDSTRLALSPPDIWREISAANAGPLRDALTALIEVLERLRADLGSGSELERVFASAGEWKRRLDAGATGPTI